MQWLETRYLEISHALNEVVAANPHALAYAGLAVVAVVIGFWWLKPKSKRQRNIFRQ